MQQMETQTPSLGITREIIDPQPFHEPEDGQRVDTAVQEESSPDGRDIQRATFDHNDFAAETLRDGFSPSAAHEMEEQ